MKKKNAPQESWRFLNRDGSINIARNSVKRRFLTDTYHFLVSTSWPGFFLSISGIFILVNVLFAAAYYFCGALSFKGTESAEGASFFLDCFFLSVQTLSTIGYSHVSPASFAASLIGGIEAFAGLLGLAILTSMLYARFSRPIARIIFSRKAVLGTDDGEPAFFFRVANERQNDVSEARINVIFIRNETNAEGEKYRRLYDLKLIRDYSPIFALTWTIVHKIDGSSPLKGMDIVKLKEAEAEMLVTLTGIDYAFSQPLHARYSYSADDIAENMIFEDMISRRADDKLIIKLSKIHDMTPVRPPAPQAK